MKKHLLPVFKHSSWQNCVLYQSFAQRFSAHKHICKHQYAMPYPLWPSAYNFLRCVRGTLCSVHLWLNLLLQSMWSPYKQQYCATQQYKMPLPRHSPTTLASIATSSTVQHDYTLVVFNRLKDYKIPSWSSKLHLSFQQRSCFCYLILAILRRLSISKFIEIVFIWAIWLRSTRFKRAAPFMTHWNKRPMKG